ncbi:pyruvate kinase [Myxosarcina sp. GI1]|uniref:pyruvate kinase n=1 Tax=Myxosarcina sp. GI1 TaxID=1541065 RepID=UPI00055E0B37|nr:pyruvate kinase [Myxosarcina sp. GI1]
MMKLDRRTKIVATIGPASSSPEIIRSMVLAGMNVARLNFSHGSYEEHAKMVSLLRSVSVELKTSITILQDLQGPKIRVAQLPHGSMFLQEGTKVTLVSLEEYDEQPDTIAIDYPFLAKEAEPEAQILLDDGLLELVVESVEDNKVVCQVVEGGILKSRKGVNLPGLNLSLPSMTEKDKRDLEFGLSQDIDWISLSFVRRGEDIRILKQFLATKGRSDIPVMAKIEKPQAIANLAEILTECDGLMVARGDLGVEMSPEKVPALQKDIIRNCNLRNIPVITATQMLDSMIDNPRPTRAEASDVANAIVDGTDAVMLSGESAVGKYPVKAVRMLAKIAASIEPKFDYVNNPPAQSDETHALSEALNAIDKTLKLRCIATFTTTGYTALIASGERPRVPVVAFTPNIKVYHRLNLIWGIEPIHVEHQTETFEQLVQLTETQLRERNLATTGDLVLIMGGIPTRKPKGTNFLKIHTIGDSPMSN